MVDYYKILGLTHEASGKEIKAAYRTLAKKYHPDVVKNDPEKNKRMYEIQEAYGVLGDEIKRKQYDSVINAERESKDGRNKRESTNSSKVNPGNKTVDMSQFEQFFGFQPGKGMDTYQGKRPKNEGPINYDDLFASFFGMKK